MALHDRLRALIVVPREEKMLETHLPRVVYHRVYLVYEDCRGIGFDRLTSVVKWSDQKLGECAGVCTRG